jgi:hypothetical protein
MALWLIKLSTGTTLPFFTFYCLMLYSLNTNKISLINPVVQQQTTAWMAKELIQLVADARDLSLLHDS